MIRDVRTWELADTINDYAQTHADTTAGSVVFEPRFRVPGVDTLRIGEYTEARDRLLALAAQPESVGKEVVVGTCSPCHGAVSLLRLNVPAALGV
jgi:hypothetical protein